MPIVLITGLLLSLLAALAWFTTKNISAYDLILNLLRWISMSVICLTIFSSLNALEFITALKWMKVPGRIAIALGVSLRFFPVVAHEASRIVTIQKLRFSRRQNLGTLAQLYKLVEAVVPGLFVSTLRQVENISLSILTQDIERRTQKHLFPPLIRFDYWLILLFVLIPIAIIAFHYWGSSMLSYGN